MSQLAGQPDRARLAALILMTVPGVPFVYYGEEIGMTGVKPDEKLRTPMQWTPGTNAGFSAGTPWQPVNAGYETVNVQTASADPASLLNWYRKLIALRNDHPALRVGSFEPLETNKLGVYAFLRRHGDETFLGIYNFDSGPVTGYTLKLAGGKLAGPLSATDVLSGRAGRAAGPGRRGRFRWLSAAPPARPAHGLFDPVEVGPMMDALFPFHPRFVHFPIALSLAGVLFVAVGLARAGAAERWLWAGRWLVFLGWIGAVVAGITGLIDQSHAPDTPAVRDTINLHITAGIALMVVFGLALYWPLKDKRLLSGRRGAMGLSGPAPAGRAADPGRELAGRAVGV